MTRKTVKPSTDHQVFKRTAASTKKVNIAPKTMRGGTRL